MSDTRACRQPGANPDDWFARIGTARAAKAKAACGTCPMQIQCRNMALNEGIPYGIFGGLDEVDRDEVWKHRGGTPTHFMDAIDAAMSPLMQERRDFDNFDKNHPVDFDDLDWSESA